MDQLHQFLAHYLRNMTLLLTPYNELVLPATRPYLMTTSTSFQDTSNASCPRNTTESAVLSPKNHIWTFARMCVSSAFRVATPTLVLNHLDLLNGLTWLDVYYFCSAVMALFLRVLWVPHSGTRPDVILTKKTSKDITIQVVTGIRKALGVLAKARTGSDSPLLWRGSRRL